MMNGKIIRLLKWMGLIAVGGGIQFGSLLCAVESDLDFEWLEGDGIRYTTWSGSALIPTEGGEWSLGLSWQDVGVEYLSTGFPVDIITEDQDRSEQLTVLELEWASWISETVQSRTGLTVSEGWGSHTGIWLDEYYRQVWQGRSIKGDTYEDPSPSSLGLSQTLRWDYAPGTAQLLVTLGASRRDIAPGYEFEVEGERAGELVRGISRLTDMSLDISSENSLHAKLKVRNGLTISKTTERQERFTFRSGANFALDEYWVLRATGVYVRESSDFEAKKLELQLVREFGAEWAVYASTSFYTDSGEIEQSNLATDANPKLETLGWTMGIVWNDLLQRQGFRLTVGSFEQNFGVNQLDRRFENLYADRRWWLVRLGYSLNF